MVSVISSLLAQIALVTSPPARFPWQSVEMHWCWTSNRCGVGGYKRGVGRVWLSLLMLMGTATHEVLAVLRIINNQKSARRPHADKFHLH